MHTLHDDELLAVGGLATQFPTGDGGLVRAVEDASLRHPRGNDVAKIVPEPMTSLQPLCGIGDQIAETVESHLAQGRREAWDMAVDLSRRRKASEPGMSIVFVTRNLGVVAKIAGACGAR